MLNTDAIEALIGARQCLESAQDFMIDYNNATGNGVGAHLDAVSTLRAYILELLHEERHPVTLQDMQENWAADGRNE